MIQSICRWCAVAIVGASLAPAQLPPGGWLHATLQDVTVLDQNGTVTARWTPYLGAPGPGPVCVDEAGTAFVRWYPWQVSQLDFVPATQSLRWAGAASLASGTTLVNSAAFAVDRESVWFVGTGGDYGQVRKPIASRPAVLLGNLRTRGQISGFVRSVAVDGRELFFAVDVGTADAWHVFAVDLRAPAAMPRGLAALPAGSLPRTGPSLALGPDGGLLVLDFHSLWAIDTVAGGATYLGPSPADPLFQLGGSLAYDPWDDQVAAAPLNLAATTHLYRRRLRGGAWTLFHSSSSAGHVGVATTSPRPFERFGVGCSNAFGTDPRLGWSGLPRPGQAFAISVRGAEPGGMAVFWLGRSDSFWAAVGPLPFEAAAFGAPGCHLWVAADAPTAVAVGGAGRAELTVSLPDAPALLGLQVFAQAACSTSVNALGLAASDALIIRIR